MKIKQTKNGTTTLAIGTLLSVPMAALNSAPVHKPPIRPNFVFIHADEIMPKGVTFDSHCFAPQLRGEKGKPREWIFVQLGSKWYVRDQGFKLTQNGELYDMNDALFVEKAIAPDLNIKAAAKARKRLQTILDKLNPAGSGLSLNPCACECFHGLPVLICNA